MPRFPVGCGRIFPWWPRGRAGEIVWVAGVRMADPVKLLPDSREVLEITVAPANADTARIWEILRRVREG